MMFILTTVTSCPMREEYQKQLKSVSTNSVDISMLCISHDRFEKAIESPQMYARTLNNLATMYYRLGKLLYMPVIVTMRKRK